jgi:hypothetical protein
MNLNSIQAIRETQGHGVSQRPRKDFARPAVELYFEIDVLPRNVASRIDTLPTECSFAKACGRGWIVDGGHGIRTRSFRQLKGRHSLKAFHALKERARGVKACATLVEFIT